MPSGSVTASPKGSVRDWGKGSVTGRWIQSEWAPVNPSAQASTLQLETPRWMRESDQLRSSKSSAISPGRPSFSTMW